MDRYDPYTDKFLRDTQYGVLGTDVPDINVGDMISRQAVFDICDHAIDAFRGQFGAGVLDAIREHCGFAACRARNHPLQGLQIPQPVY